MQNEFVQLHLGIFLVSGKQVINFFEHDIIDLG